MKRLTSVIIAVIMLFQLSTSAFAAGTRLDIWVMGEGQSYMESGIYFTPGLNREITVKAGPGEISLMKVTPSGEGSVELAMTRKDDSYTYGKYTYKKYGIHKIEVYGEDGTYKRITIDIHIAVPATTSVTYETRAMMVTSANGEPVNPPKPIMLYGQGRIPETFWPTLDDKSIWPEVEHDGRIYNFKGYGMIIVHNGSRDKEDEVGPFKVTVAKDFKELTERWGWSQSSLAAFKQAKDMELSWQAPYDGEVLVKIWLPDGKTIVRGKDKKIPIHTYETISVQVNGKCDNEEYILDPDKKSQIWQGDTDDAEKLEGMVSPKDITDTKVINATLTYENRSILAHYYYKKKLEKPTGHFGIDATPDNLQIIKSEKINSAASLAINMKQDTGDLAKWEKYIEGRPLQLSVSITRDLPGASITTATPYNANGTYANITEAQLLKYLKGDKLIYVDAIKSYPIGEEETVEFNYTATVKVKVGNEEIVLTPDPGTDYVKFYRMVQKVNYTSIPSYWSEIKEGAPLNESFEAMAGTPTTRHLYFASGGSEFIVDIEAKYVPDGSADRTYTSYFTSVPCGWSMDPITGGRQKDSAPPKPAARTKVDSSGASFTETVSQHSAPYIKGYTSGEHPQPIYGTEYWWVQEGHVHPSVGGYTDTWTQSSTFDYMKITKAHVWKLDRSKVDGMATLLGTDEVTATVVSGDPTLFYNITSSNTSAAGRLRYSLETDQHDHVVWNEGSSDNAHANTPTAGTVNEQQKFNERRNMTTDVTAISDFLILQTSSGDQSVLYFEKKSPAKKTTEALEVPKTSKETMWDSNPLSAAQWSVSRINIGSYNGNYSSPATKYNSGGGPTVSTIFDSLPAGMSRPGRPGSGMRLVQTGLDVIDTLPNGEYVTGQSSVFYRLMLNEGGGMAPYNTAYNGKYGANGQEFYSTYSPNHTKVNDIVLHNPVSTQFAIVMPLPDGREQRTPATQGLGGNLQPPEIEYERVFKENPPKQNLLYNGDAEIVNPSGALAGWNKGEWNASGVYTHTVRTNDATWTLSGSRSFEIYGINEPPGSSASYYKDITTIPMTDSYTLKGKLAAHRCTATLELFFFSGNGDVIGSTQAGRIDNNHIPLEVNYTFTPPAGTAKIRVEMRKGVTTSGTIHSYLFADDLELINNNVTNTWLPYDPVYEESMVPNPEYVPPAPVLLDYSYTGNVQTFTAPANGTYTLEVWGAQGGNGSGGEGGYSKGDITLSKGEVLYLYVGGSNGWNGGGTSGYAESVGGGGTDIRRGGQTLNDRIIVAGGGGGNGPKKGGAGGGLTGNNGEAWCGHPGYGGSQTAGGYSRDAGYGSFGQGGYGEGHISAGGGGGGWYGGGGGSTDYPNYNDHDDSGGGGGSGYIGGVINGITQVGGRTGHGAIRITAPALASSEPQLIAMKVISDNQPPSNPPESWYEMVTRTLAPDAAVPIPNLGNVSAGGFINLDYPFYVYFPNRGNFRGNDALGISSTTSQRGRGFTDPMDTTEWTKYKSVTFSFNVLYNGVAYKAGQEISLEVNEEIYEFYCVLANYEAPSAVATFKVVANNNNENYMDNTYTTNRLRDGSLAAKHSGIKTANIDIVGRIGNMTLVDTGDFRFANFFKMPVQGDSWIVPNLVKRVDPAMQNKIIGSSQDIRGNPVGPATKYLDTYGMLSHLRQSPESFPLSPERNNIDALRKQPMRLGYNVFADIQTIGNYYDRMQILMYYYHLNLKDGTISPVDVYMKVDGSYELINKHGAAVPGWDPSQVHEYIYNLDWDEENSRRNYGLSEECSTELAAIAYNTNIPGGSYYPFGTAQVIYPKEKNRTFIGSTFTYNQDKNPENKFSPSFFNVQAQRWHFTYGLPSSAVVVLAGQEPTQVNIDALRNSNSVILAAADITAIGNPYYLRYTHPEGNQPVVINGVTYPTTAIPYAVLSVFSANKSSADDLDVKGTH